MLIFKNHTSFELEKSYVMDSFYRCEKCGNIVDIVECGGGQLVCCGAKMTPLKAGAVEASHEKHIPTFEVSDGIVKVNVGSATHPMSEEHHISWIYLETDNGGARKVLSHTGAPEAIFALSNGERPVAVYAYCNLHGLWKADV